MEFPKAPSKKTSGKVRFVIKPPGVETAVEPEPVPPEPGPDDRAIKLKLPPGFLLDDSFDSFLLRQKKNALLSIDGIEARYNKCGACKKKNYSQELLDEARLLVEQIASDLLGSVFTTVQLVIGHDKNGEISVHTTYQDRGLFIILRDKGNEVGYYHKGELTKTEALSLDNRRHALDWLKGQ